MTRVDDLAAQVAELRAEIEDLRHELVTEVRTRRLVVVDRHGREAVYTTELPESMSLTVTWPWKNASRRDERSMVDLVAGHEDGLGSGGVSVSVGGEIVADLGGVARERGWLDGDLSLYRKRLRGDRICSDRRLDLDVDGLYDTDGE